MHLLLLTCSVCVPGYAGYVPAKYASKLTPEQQALKAVANEASYELMAKVVRNVVRLFMSGSRRIAAW